MVHLLVKIPPRESFKIPSKQWAWLDELSGGMLFESVSRGFHAFSDNPKKNPLWVVCPRIGEFSTMVFCSDSETLASEEMKLLLMKSPQWNLVGEWRSDEMDYLSSQVESVERWTGRL